MGELLNITPKLVIVTAGTAIVLYLFAKKEASDALRAIGNSVNPLSDENLIYKSLNAVSNAIAGNDGETFGGWLYEITHKSPNAPVKSATVNPVYRPVGAIYNYLP